MITNKTAREFVIAKKLFPDISTSVIETDTATGAIASFETNMSAPIVNGVFEFNPVQEGTGDPSPSNPRPITGFTGLNITRATGDITTNTINGYYIDSNGTFQANSGYKIVVAPVSEGKTYKVFTDEGQTIAGFFTSNPNTSSVTYNNSRTITNPGVFEITAPIDGYIGFRCSANYSSSAIWDISTTYPISWQTEAGTVYGGELNATTGELKPFKEYDSYNGETLTGPWLCSQAPYVAGTTPPTGSQVVDLGAYDTTVQLTPQEVRTLLGENNIYHDCNGDSTITYKKSVPEPTTTDKRQFLPLIYGKKYYRKEY